MKGYSLNSTRTIDYTWGLLILLTIGGALVGEAQNPGFWMNVLVAALMLFKGRLVTEHFLEIGSTRPALRRLVRFYAVIWPLMIIITYLFGTEISRFTQL